MQLKRFILSVCLLTMPAVAHGAIGFNAVTEFHGGILPNSIFGFIDCEGDKRLISVKCVVPGLVVNSVTHNSVALTKSTSTAPTGGEVSSWYLVNPSVGNLSVAVIFSGNYTAANCAAICLTGVDQGAPLDAVKASSGTGTTASLSINIVNTGAWIIDGVGNFGTGNAFTVGGSQVQRWNATNSGDDGAGSTLGPVSSGANTMSWTQSSAVWGQVADSFKAAASNKLTISRSKMVISRSKLVVDYHGH